MKDPYNIFNSKPRVLIVDNNERIVNMYKELIFHWGYSPVLAQGVGNRLLEDAKRKVREHRCQLALVDLRLVDDLDEEDVSGLNLVPELKPAVSLIVSASSDVTMVRQSDEIGAASFVLKGEDPKVLKEKLEREAGKLCASRTCVKIGPPSVLSHIASILCEQVPSDYHDQIADVFTRLFPSAKRLLLERVGTEAVLTVPRPKSVILRVTEDDKQPVIVKLARAHKMSIEVNRFRKYVEGYLKGHFHPSISNPVILWDLAGAIYISLGSTESTIFSKYFADASMADIEYSLTRFFRETWSSLYTGANRCENISLFREYCKVWGIEWYERVCRFHAPDPQEMMKNEFPNELKPIDPIDWFKKNFGDSNAKDKSMTPNTALAITHGDLHGDNLLVDENRNAWVIDFERSGEGHILQDFVELESDIINRLISSNENLPSFYQLCLYITQDTELKRLNNTDQIADPDVKKSIQTISLLRKLAREISGFSDARQYLLGLLFNTLFRATIISDSARQIGQFRALMLASIICHRLDHWNDPWPPKEWRELK
jgi:DNA-binding NarL/FixJ family response regulator